MLDGWMHPVDDEIHGRVKQPALMLNMESFQWKENVEQMFRLTEDTSADRPMITIKYGSLCSSVVSQRLSLVIQLSLHVSASPIGYAVFVLYYTVSHCLCCCHVMSCRL